MENAPDHLTVHTKAEEGGYVTLWRVGVRRQGTIHTTLNIELDDPLAVAELCAMHHLIQDLAVLGANRGPASLKFTISVPTIRKLMRGTSDKKHLYPYAILLTTKYVGVEVETDKDAAWVGPSAATRVSALTVTEPPTVPIEVLGYGAVNVTKHAVDQFRLRLNNATPLEAWKELERVGRDGMEQVREYRERGSVKLYHAESKWAFIVGDDRKLITAYSDFRP